MSMRVLLNTWCNSMMRAATRSGSPISKFPSGPAAASKCAAPCGGQPRSRPMRFITSVCAGPKTAFAFAVVSPTKPCMFKLNSALAGSLPALRMVSRYKSKKGAKRLGSPPIIASAIGTSNVAARTTDCGVPPTAIHTGSLACSGRG